MKKALRKIIKFRRKRNIETDSLPWSQCYTRLLRTIALYSRRIGLNFKAPNLGYRYYDPRQGRVNGKDIETK